ncbi:MAG: proteasome accessory factor PafA2 family protein [Pirellulaceae bacterium]|nr:proteasome accessory factor PafA2 family protein [Pirellulaceae bacterium]
MVVRNDQFALSAEVECLTAVPDRPDEAANAVSRFLRLMSEAAPSLPATQGIFTGYAKIYSDVGHVELALVECDDPYLLPSLFERVQVLAARVLGKLQADGVRMLLANNNHSGLLQEGCPVWGDHENHLVEQHPTTFADRILPFLVTRIYHGAGGIHHPSGNYLAAVRPVCMELATGGGTTSHRAIHSTAREEHHMGGSPSRFRYHLILGDGHRSHFNLALQFGATALALKAVLFDRQLARDLTLLRSELPADWVAALRMFNLLAAPGGPPQVHPLVIKIQRVYLEAAERYVAALEQPPDWTHRTLHDWRATLDAFQRMDRGWLAERLDAFIKYEFYSALLGEGGRDWRSLPGDHRQFCELALLDHSYHEFCNPSSVFDRLDRAGVLQHRVGPRILPGDEPEPFVPETTTRARARARFIRDHARGGQFAVDWSWIHDVAGNRRASIEDPFASELAPWQSLSQHAAAASSSAATGAIPSARLAAATGASAANHLREALKAYDQGRYALALTLLDRVGQLHRLSRGALPPDAVRFRAWIRTRCGQTDGPALLEELYRGRTLGLFEITDFCCVYRFHGLTPRREAAEPWIALGQQTIGADPAARTRGVSDVFLEHLAYIRLRQGNLAEARSLADELRTPERMATAAEHIKGRILATAGETYRILGQRRLADQLLRAAAEHQVARQQEGYLGDMTYPFLAKLQPTRRRAQQWLSKAGDIQRRNNHSLGHALTLLLEARCGTAGSAAEHRQQIEVYRRELPALTDCPLLARILEHWTAWTSGDQLADQQDRFWGL